MRAHGVRDGEQGPFMQTSSTCLVLLLALSTIAAHPAAAQSKKQRKMVQTVIDYIRANDYAREAQVSVAPNLCTCVEASCDDANDFRVNCGGGTLPFPGVQGYLTAVGASPGTASTCGTCGCNASTTPMSLVVTAICVAAP